jgi:hypothetical protein
MRRHFLRVLEGAAIGEIGSDPSGAECVIADGRGDASSRRTPTYHEPGGVLIHGTFGERIGIVSGRGAEQTSLTVFGDAGGINIEGIASGVI